MPSEPHNKDDLNKKWPFQYKRVSDPVGFSSEQYRDAKIPVVSKILQDKGANINVPNYKHKDRDYTRIRNEYILGFPGGAMSLEEFIDRFMPTEYTFESKYDMGNSCEIEDSECTEYAIITEIMRNYDDKRVPTIDDIRYRINRKGGLIDHIEKCFGINFNKLGRKDAREKRERSKILYFFYMFNFRKYPNTNVFRLLDKPSMESIDNTFLGWQTHNGNIVKFVKESLGKELSLEEKDRVYSAIANISLEWDNILSNAQLLLDFLHDYGFDYNSTELLPSSIPVFMSSGSNQEDTYQYPVERLYLTVSQREYLGNLYDIAHINRIENGNDYAVPPELVEEMKSLRHTPVDFNDVEKYINIKGNALRLSHYVYPGKKTDKEDVRRIRTYAHKLQKFLSFCNRANCVMPIQKISNELQLVSYLQAAILDDKGKNFNYIYYGYQNVSTHMKGIRVALRSDKRVPDALQVYWVRKVTDRWYANVGKYDVRLKLRQIEQTCDEIRKQILSQPTLDGMMAAHNFYMKQVDPGSFDVENQIQAVSHVVNFLHDLGFKYEDYECKIRYAFLDSKNWKVICGSILMDIQAAIQNHRPFYPSRCGARGTAVKDAGFSLEFAFDYTKKVCTLTQFELILG